MLLVLLNFTDLEFKKILSCIAQAVQKCVYFHYQVYVIALQICFTI